MLHLFLATALADAPPPAWAIDPARDLPMTWRQPDPGARATWIVTGRQTMDKLGVEVSFRRLVDLVVASAPGGGRTWTATTSALEIRGLSDFGPIAPRPMRNLTAERRTDWRTRRDGTIEDLVLADEGLGEVLQEALGGMAGALAIPAPPDAVRPGGAWSVDATIALPVDAQGLEGELNLETRAASVFVGWARQDDRWLARVDVEVTVELTGRVRDGRNAVELGGIGRTGSQVLIDPDTGLAAWQASRTRVTVSAGDRRPDVIEQVLVWTRP